MKYKVFSVVVAMALAMAGHASASSLTYDTTASPFWYQGTGNPDGGFVASVNNGVEIDLRAKYRQNPSVLHMPGDVYLVVGGPQTNTTSGGNGGNASRWAWNYEMGINVLGAGMTLSDIVASTFIEIQDLTKGTTSGPQGFFTSYAFDHDLFGPSGKVPETPGNLLTSWAAQNSENGAFGNFGNPGSSMFDSDYYRVILSVFGKDGQLLNSGHIDIAVNGAVPAPEPASMVTLGTGLLFAANQARRRLKRKTA